MVQKVENFDTQACREKYKLQQLSYIEQLNIQKLYENRIKSCKNQIFFIGKVTHTHKHVVGVELTM